MRRLRRGRGVLRIGGNWVLHVLHDVQLRGTVQLLLLVLLLLAMLWQHGGRLLLLPGASPARCCLRGRPGPLLLRNSRGRLDCSRTVCCKP